MGEFQQLEKSKRNEILVKIKSVEGISIRQLSRIVGISKSVIERIQGIGTVDLSLCPSMSLVPHV